MKSYSKNEWHKIREIFSLPWVRHLNSQEALDDLLTICNTKDKLQLIHDLLTRFHFVDYELRTKYFDSIVDKIINWNLNDDKTLISATAQQPNPDSSQAILQVIKPKLNAKGWGGPFVSHFGQTLKNKSSHYNDIILVDEFLGSGDTIINRINQIKDKKPSTNVRACYFAAMQKGYDAAKNICTDLYACIILKKGITDYYNDITAKNNALKTMLCLEELLDKTKDDRQSIFPFGYKKSESLFAMIEGNAVNTVFPIFWWRWRTKGKQWVPLLSRAGVYSDEN